MNGPELNNEIACDTPSKATPATIIAGEAAPTKMNVASVTPTLPSNSDVRRPIRSANTPSGRPNIRITPDGIEARNPRKPLSNPSERMYRLKYN